MRVKEQVRKLWEKCFEDDADFLDLYFERKYSKQNSEFVEVGDRIISSMQVFPYQMSFYDQTLTVGYIYGACTHPDYRRKGVMRQLLQQAIAHMKADGVDAAILIPANDDLYEYYTKFGFAPVFEHYEKQFTTSEKYELSEQFIFEEDNEFSIEKYELLSREEQKRKVCVFHSEEDYRFALDEMKLSGGKQFTITYKNRIVALAIVSEKENGNWRVEEIASTGLTVRNMLLQQICHVLNTDEIYTVQTATNRNRQKKGMLRLIDTEKIMNIYVKNNPQLKEETYFVRDNQLSSNTGYYTIGEGKMQFEESEISGSGKNISINQLSEMAFDKFHPYMSLMMED